MYETPEIHELGKVADLTLGGTGGDWESEDIAVVASIPCDRPEVLDIAGDVGLA